MTIIYHRKRLRCTLAVSVILKTKNQCIGLYQLICSHVATKPYALLKVSLQKKQIADTTCLTFIIHTYLHNNTVQNLWFCTAPWFNGRTPSFRWRHEFDSYRQPFQKVFKLFDTIVNGNDTYSLTFHGCIVPAFLAGWSSLDARQIVYLSKGVSA